MDVLVPHQRTRARARRARVRRRRALLHEVLLLGGSCALPVTGAVDTVLDCCALPLVEAVVVLDSALRARAVTVEQVQRAAGRRRGRLRSRALRVVGLCDPASGSVLESVLRVYLVLAGVVGWCTQRVVRDASGRHVLRADFCFDSARLVVETDGARWHPDPGRDRSVDNALAACGWRLLRYTWAQVVSEPARVVAQISAALAASGGAAAHRPLQRGA